MCVIVYYNNAIYLDCNHWLDKLDDKQRIVLYTPNFVCNGTTYRNNSIKIYFGKQSVLIVHTSVRNSCVEFGAGGTALNR